MLLLVGVRLSADELSRLLQLTAVCELHLQDGEHVAAFADYKAEDAQSSATDDKPSEGGPVTAQASHQQSGALLATILGRPCVLPVCVT